MQPATGPIRADLTGNMWSQDWGNIYDIVAPKDGPGLGYDLTKQLVDHGYDAVSRSSTPPDNWYQSIGLPAKPATFWTRSMILHVRATAKSVCHASAWDLDSKDDLRVKACFTVTADDFYTAHHELGHNMYQRAYDMQPYLFQGGGANGRLPTKRSATSPASTR